MSKRHFEFDSKASREAKRSSMRQVDDNANAAWKAAAYDAVERAAKERPYLTTDDVVLRISDNVNTHEWRALGPIMRKAAKLKWIEKATGVDALFCQRRSRHSAPLQVWKSLIYERDRYEPATPAPPPSPEIITQQSRAAANLEHFLRAYHHGR